MESSLPPNNSNEQLMENEDDRFVPRRTQENTHGEKSKFRSLSRKEWLTVGVLCYVNLINYMDRYTMAGIMPSIKDHFHFGDDIAGLLQTVFVISYMIFAPLFGYLGDRYNRKAIMAFGVCLWSLTTLLGSFMNTTVSFVLLRAFVGIGEASYSTIAPTIISDLFVKDLRAKVLALFYFAIPVGSGMGYIVGSEMARVTNSWQWALRVTPIMGCIAVFCIIFVVHEPERGESEGGSHTKATSWSQDLRLLIRNRSFMYSTLGFMSVSFVAGALSWWGPDYIYRGVKLQPGKENTSLHELSFIFGVLTMISGLLGVPLGSYLSTKLRKKFQRIDPLICGFGLIFSTALFTAAMFTANYNFIAFFTLAFLGQLAINLNWAVVADILLYVVTPRRRSTAEAFQILISHMFGDAGSPYLVGVVADAIAKKFRSGEPYINQTVSIHEDEISYYSLQYSLFMTCFVEFMGGVFFLLTSFYIIQDRMLAEKEVKGDANERLTNFFADEPVQQPSMI
ncbi:UNVERIFIED_CONTAM: hypothetical protein PYX00_005050 [Menopon gallinae]|uniref:Major facilitator superfamily (MFS) profile domain-containing protein n=1 Tax=Menopon gallinae TaxID=328185 RepID=A0AAW2HPG9_9NEOP